MSLPAGTEGLIGTHYRYPDYFDVGREKIREFAAAISNDHPSHHFEDSAAEIGYDTTVAPLTFLAVAGRRVQMDVFTKFDIPINMARVLHRDQKFLYHRPITAGDRLYFDTYCRDSQRSHRRRRQPHHHQHRHHARRVVKPRRERRSDNRGNCIHPRWGLISAGTF
jgi:N-terminal half of MaoC dehydratase